MKNIFKYILSIPLVFALVSCNEDEVLDGWIAENPVPETLSGDKGDADLSNLVVLGTSLASGFQDGALYDAGQANSFPALLAAQFQVSGIGGTTDFGQPDINSANGYNMLANDKKSGRSELDLSLKAPVNTVGEIASILTPWSGTAKTLNNFGVPLTQAAQLVVAATGGPVTDTYGGKVPAADNPAYNPFYKRFASNPSADGATGSTPLKDALSAGGSFFVYEAGINDIALYAIGGATNLVGPTTAAATYKASAYAAIKMLATAGGNAYEVEGVVLNVPPILDFPFFQAVTYNAIPLDAATATSLNTGLAAVNAAIKGTAKAGYTGDVSGRLMSYAEGKNAILVIDESLDDLGPFFDILVGGGVLTAEDRFKLTPYEQSRPLIKGEIVPLGTSPHLGVEADGDADVADTPLGLVIPLGFDFAEFAHEPLGGDSYYIDAGEKEEIEINRELYNEALAETVSAVNAAGGDVVLVDIASIFLDAAGTSDGVKGIDAQGLNLDPDFAPNGIFSTDGLHPCQRGHGLIANKIIGAINTKWKASVPEVSIGGLPGPPFKP